MTLNNMKTMKKERGFTIVELLIVIVVIGILAAIVIVAYTGVSNRAKASKAQSAASTVIKKVEAYNAELGSYPTGPTGLTSAASTTSYYLTGVTFAATMASAPSDENTLMFSTCITPAGIRLTYWNYAANPAAVAHLYTGGATGSSTCTPTVS